MSRSLPLAYHDLMQFAEVQRTQPREFLGSNTPATRGLPVARVPRKFRRGTCTLTIGVLKDSGYVPGERRGPNLPASDVGNWVELAHKAGVVLAGCVRQGRPGWTWSGENSGLGVFFWTTNSGKDMEVIPAALLMPGARPENLSNGTSDVSVDTA
ncbi:MAG: hypothetical protein LQ349_002127 [Xanthoria aureola]|nr:MAG: hypothetical protein LQ349_002127 [Xanthoria aureola]